MSQLNELVDQLLEGNNITEGMLKARWRELASKHHPDRGGDPEEFKKFREAYEICLKRVRRPAKCGECAGEGKVQQVRGFSSVLVPCPTCGGNRRIV